MVGRRQVPQRQTIGMHLETGLLADRCQGLAEALPNDLTPDALLPNRCSPAASQMVVGEN